MRGPTSSCQPDAESSRECAGSVPFWTARVMLSCDGGFPIPQGVAMQCDYDLFEVPQTVVNSRFCRALQCEDPVH